MAAAEGLCDGWARRSHGHHRVLEAPENPGVAAAAAPIPIAAAASRRILVYGGTRVLSEGGRSTVRLYGTKDPTHPEMIARIVPGHYELAIPPWPLSWEDPDDVDEARLVNARISLEVTEESVRFFQQITESASGQVRADNERVRAEREKAGFTHERVRVVGNTGCRCGDEPSCARVFVGRYGGIELEGVDLLAKVGLSPRFPRPGEDITIVRSLVIRAA